MFAFFLAEADRTKHAVESVRSSLSAFGNHEISHFETGRVVALTGQLPNCSSPADRKHFAAADGTITLIDGWLDNREASCRELGLTSEASEANVYYHAVERWSDQADLYLTGHYAAVVASADGTCRLSRSPIGARPLHWAWIDGVLVVASTPRLLAAAGLRVKLDQRTLADSMFLNLTEFNGWLESSWRLGVGQIAHVSGSSEPPQPTRYWKPENIAVNREISTRQAIARTEKLLSESITDCLSDTSSPGVLLSGGLDSSNVAARAAKILGPDTPLPSFTFAPSSQWYGEEPHWGYGDETSRVRAFAELHPTLRPHFIADEGNEFDSHWDQVFSAIGCAPPGLTNISMYHGLFDAARKAGCDRLISAEYGNQSFSIAADWSVAEFVRKGRWGEAWQQITSNTVATTSRWRRFLRAGFAANLPDSTWRLWQAIKGHDVKSPQEQIAALNPHTAARLDVQSRADQAGLLSPRNFPGSRQEWMRDIFARGDMGSGEIEVAFEQIYGISQRDPTAYRPLIEHCLSLPTEMFARDGQDRWLAREMSRGVLPEARRLEQKAGMHNADWHSRITPQLGRIRQELEAAADREELRELFDFDELLDRLDNWPDQPDFSEATTYRLQMGIPIALMTARFVRHSYGWNE